MPVPVGDEADIVVVFPCFFDDFGDFVPKGVEGLLLCNLTLEQFLHAAMVLLDQLVEVALGLLILGS